MTKDDLKIIGVLIGDTVSALVVGYAGFKLGVNAGETLFTGAVNAIWRKYPSLIDVNNVKAMKWLIKKKD